MVCLNLYATTLVWQVKISLMQKHQSKWEQTDIFLIRPRTEAFKSTVQYRGTVFWNQSQNTSVTFTLSLGIVGYSLRILTSGSPLVGAWFPMTVFLDSDNTKLIPILWFLSFVDDGYYAGTMRLGNAENHIKAGVYLSKEPWAAKPSDRQDTTFHVLTALRSWKVSKG